jgi:hypothetical protein
VGKLRVYEDGIDPERSKSPLGEKAKTVEEEEFDCLLDMCEDAATTHGITMRTIVVMMKRLGVSYPPTKVAQTLWEKRRVRVVKE